jgi:hypothetical protein
MECKLWKCYFFWKPKQNSLTFEAGFSSSMMRFGEISIAMVLQIHPGFR